MNIFTVLLSVMPINVKWRAVNLTAAYVCKSLLTHDGINYLLPHHSCIKVTWHSKSSQHAVAVLIFPVTFPECGNDEARCVCNLSTRARTLWNSVFSPSVNNTAVTARAANTRCSLFGSKLSSPTLRRMFYFISKHDSLHSVCTKQFLPKRNLHYIIEMKCSYPWD